MRQKDEQMPERFIIYFHDSTDVGLMPIGEAKAERKQITQVLPGKVDQESGKILELDTITRHLFILTEDAHLYDDPDKIITSVATPVGNDQCIFVLPTMDRPKDYKKGMTFVEERFF